MEIASRVISSSKRLRDRSKWANWKREMKCWAWRRAWAWYDVITPCIFQYQITFGGSHIPLKTATTPSIWSLITAISDHLLTHHNVLAPRRATGGGIQRHHNCAHFTWFLPPRSYCKISSHFHANGDSVKLTNEHLIYVFECDRPRSLRLVR